MTPIRCSPRDARFSLGENPFGHHSRSPFPDPPSYFFPSSFFFPSTFRCHPTPKGTALPLHLAPLFAPPPDGPPRLLMGVGPTVSQHTESNTSTRPRDVLFLATCPPILFPFLSYTGHRTGTRSRARPVFPTPFGAPPPSFPALSIISRLTGRSAGLASPPVDIRRGSFTTSPPPDIRPRAFFFFDLTFFTRPFFPLPPRWANIGAPSPLILGGFLDAALSPDQGLPFPRWLLPFPFDFP